jgi:hypothetical protein
LGKAFVGLAVYHAATWVAVVALGRVDSAHTVVVEQVARRHTERREYVYVVASGVAADDRALAVAAQPER